MIDEMDMIGEGTHMQIPLETLRSIVGAPHVLTGDDVSSRREDWMTGAPCQAGAIVRPADTEQLSGRPS